MKLHTLKYLLAGIVLTGFVSCSNDDDNTPITVEPEPVPAGVDFSGTFAQQDQMGRAAINTVLGGTSAEKNTFNVTIPSEMEAGFQAAFLNKAVALHGAFGVEYEQNILGLNAQMLTTILSQDVLQVAPEGPTTYFAGTLDAPTSVLTGRTLSDDVVDVSLILLFGGMDGQKYNGQTPETPILVTDNVSAGTGAMGTSTFPYLVSPQ